MARVHYPGLETHPQHALARRQQHGFGAMLSFELRDGTGSASITCSAPCAGSRWPRASAGVESLVAHPATMTHASMTPEARRRAGITDDVIRLSIGIEDPEDLIGDLEQSLRRLPD